MEFSDAFLAHFGKNWGIDRNLLLEAVKNRIDTDNKIRL
jgi:hypothetical protein